MKKFTFLFLMIFFFLHAEEKPVFLKKKWETKKVLNVPESVIFDKKRKRIYVANINGKPSEKDGNGFISILDLSGNVKKLKWIKGLDAPKGMGISGKRLFVTDISVVVEIDIPSSKIVNRYPINGKFLNDITVGKDGTIYISDWHDNSIYLIKEGKFELFLKSEKLNTPNGLLFKDEKLYIASTGGSDMKEVDIKTKKIRNIVIVGGRPDGIVDAGNGNFIISSWNGEVSYISNNLKVTKLLNTVKEKINSADIEYVKKNKLLLVPTFFDNRVVAYEVLESK